ncbi:hypothetical protein [Xenococcus sp. PCC 7305]|uniref:hypothetical protein n=1 Tax=Xenococcus sp. PCC 7305 TaxID=102125 RepID=UPI0002F0E340|nr:hypothetical protein [Xenococcus sp. PCC 7305]
MNKLQRLKTLLALIAIASTVPGCLPPDKIEDNVPTAINLEESTQTIQDYLKNQPPETTPIRIGVTQDKTSSLEANRVKRLSLEKLDPLLEFIGKNGGELAYLRACNDSNMPMSRVKISQPPRLDDQDLLALTLPTKPDENANPLFAHEGEEQRQKERETFKEGFEHNSAIIAAHEEAIKDWETSTQNKLNQYRQQLQTLSQQPLDCPATDIYGAIQRNSLFFQEDTSIWTKKPQDWIIFITDGLHNTANQKANFPQDTNVLLVNGGTTVGVFKDIEHQSFEAPTAAIDYVLHNAK